MTIRLSDSDLIDIFVNSNYVLESLMIQGTEFLKDIIKYDKDDRYEYGTIRKLFLCEASNIVCDRFTPEFLWDNRARIFYKCIEKYHLIQEVFGDNKYLGLAENIAESVFSKLLDYEIAKSNFNNNK